MIERIEELYAKKIGAVRTTEAEVAKLDANIERKRRLIAKAQAEIDSQTAAIAEKESKKGEFLAKIEFQREGAEAIKRHLDQVTELRAELDRANEAHEAAKSWGSDATLMMRMTTDPDSEFSRTKAERDRVYEEIRRLTEWAQAEYNRPWIR